MIVESKIRDLPYQQKKKHKKAIMTKTGTKRKFNCEFFSLGNQCLKFQQFQISFHHFPHFVKVVRVVCKASLVSQHFSRSYQRNFSSLINFSLNNSARRRDVFFYDVESINYFSGQTMRTIRR
jgi:hypothetical protein